MGTYKVLQDIEAEDKLIGPLSLRQAIFAAIALASSYFSFLLLTKGAWFLVIPFVPVITVTGFLAFPWGRDQPTEVWLLAKIRFFIKPRLRKWDQEGIEELVTITVPKKVDEGPLTKDFGRDEAKSRLRALADTIDSRGWAVKNVDLNMYTQPAFTTVSTSDDRLVDASAYAAPLPVVDIHAEDDILDEHNNLAAQHLDEMLTASTVTHRQELLESLHPLSSPVPIPTSSKSPKPEAPPTPIPQAANPTADEQALFQQIKQSHHQQPAAYGHMHTLQPLSDHGANQHTKTAKPAPSSQLPAPNNRDTASSASSPDPAILELANNDDLNVATIARQAHKATDTPPDEVVVSLR